MTYKSHYDALSLSQTATKAEIRARFLKLVRIVSVASSVVCPGKQTEMLTSTIQYHPDKTRAGSSLSGSTSSPSIHDLYEAYNVLSDRRTRQEHDVELAHLRDSNVRSVHQTPTRREARISATLDLDAFTAQESEGESDLVTFAYPCRCGSQFVTTSEELLTDELELIECTGCSEVVRVLWKDEAGRVDGD